MNAKRVPAAFQEELLAAVNALPSPICAPGPGGETPARQAPAKHGHAKPKGEHGHGRARKEKDD